ncbi:MAG: ATP-dependent DNA helicase RecG [Hyphomicrobiales bacterium]|nr:ATP-dependent DNA helicase RecG [Hyphomicrobiales bacterium]
MRPTILNPLFVPVSNLSGIGPKLEKALTRLLVGAETGEIARICNLLFHIPHSIIDRRNQPDIASATHSSIVTLKIHVDRHQPSPPGRKNVPYRIHVHDQSGEMTLVFFQGRAQWLEKLLPVGETRFISGTFEWYNGQANMVHPDHVVSEQEFSDLPLVEPVYPAAAGVSQKVLTKAIKTALETLPQLPEWGNAALISREKWDDFNTALAALHQPRDLIDLQPNSPSRRRLAYDEYLSGQLALALLRMRLKKLGGRARKPGHRFSAAIREAFPHQLSHSQNQAFSEIQADLQKPERMLRLLQGDVGSGKTIVALLAMAEVVEDGAQAAIMAPTEILARQHFQSIGEICKKVDLRVEILTGREKGPARKDIYQRMKSGELQIIIGTHALFQSKVEFNNLGLAVIDEQHRFGVHQRLMLSDKGSATDILVMTATPIPRTLVMTAYGDMDVSKLTEKPAGRIPVKTSAMATDKLDVLVQRIARAIENGQKIFWICPLVEESEELNLTSATQRHETLSRQLDTRVGLIHGRMVAAEKDSVMEAFRNGDTRLLVATTVVEVGVDVPDATIMVIEHAERFGLAQLHQLRGRVGRGLDASHCILLYKSPLGEIAKARINIMRESEDGFRIAEEDLRLRGEGELLGIRQSGTPGFSMASSEHHSDILEMARDDARLMVETDPALEGPRGEALRVLLYLFGQDQAVRLLRSG